MKIKKVKKEVKIKVKTGSREKIKTQESSAFQEKLINRDTSNVKPKDLVVKAKKDRLITKIKHLDAGDRFEIVKLEKQFRDLFLVFLSAGSATIRGHLSTNIENTTYRPLGDNYTISLETNVRLLS